LKLGTKIFSGEIPKVDSHLLDDKHAQIASNVNLVKGSLRAVKAPLRTTALDLTTIKSLQIFVENTNSHWVESANDLDYARSPIAADTYERLYFTGETEPRFFANDNISSPFDSTVDFTKLGIPQPTAAPTVGSSGAGSTYRAYIYTYLSSYGDKGPPSLSDAITDYDTGNVTIEDIVDAPTGRAINKIYLYRTNSSSSGVAEFQFVLEATWFNATTNYDVGDFVIYLTDLYKCTTTHTAAAWNAGHFTAGDDVTDANLGEVIDSYWMRAGIIYSYEPPPAAMKGLVSLPNGVFAGFVGNVLYLSEPYRPHAYPYKISFDHQIVALGVFGTTVVVLTDGYPFLVFGTHPSSMAKRRISKFYPCLFKRSVVSEENAVFYSSKDGRIKVDQDGAENATFDIIDEDAWTDAYPPASTAWYFYGGKHFGFPGSTTGFVIDFANGIIYRLSIQVHTGHISIGDGKFYIVTDDLDAVDEDNPPANMPLCVKEWAGDDSNYLQYTWKSKKSILDFDVNMGYARVQLDQSFYNDVIALLDLATLNASLFATDDLGGALGRNAIGTIRLAGDILYDMEGVSMSPDVTFKLYADGELKFTKTLTGAFTTFALPTGYESKIYEYELSGYVPVLSPVGIAPAVEELMMP
jgi:carbohydrate binding protein with CBM5/12 domain